MSTETTIPPLRDRPAWARLESHHRQLKDTTLRELFDRDPSRGDPAFTAEGAGLFLDYSKNRITSETVELLLKLARESDLEGRRDAMFAGERINVSENRSVLHVALRMPKGTKLVVEGTDVVAQVHETLDRMTASADQIRARTWRGHTGEPITSIVNIGIGGSDLGPVMAYEALRHYADRGLTVPFVSNVDSTDFAEKTRDLDPAETLFIISSKTFTTLETMTNAHTARALDARRAQGRRARSPGTSSRSPRTPRRCRSSVSTPTTCSASGTGSAAATRWTPRSACPR